MRIHVFILHCALVLFTKIASQRNHKPPHPIESRLPRVYYWVAESVATSTLETVSNSLHCLYTF